MLTNNLFIRNEKDVFNKQILMVFISYTDDTSISCKTTSSVHSCHKYACFNETPLRPTDCTLDHHYDALSIHKSTLINSGDFASSIWRVMFWDWHPNGVLVLCFLHLFHIFLVKWDRLNVLHCRNVCWIYKLLTCCHFVGTYCTLSIKSYCHFVGTYCILSIKS